MKLVSVETATGTRKTKALANKNAGYAMNDEHRAFLTIFCEAVGAASMSEETKEINVTLKAMRDAIKGDLPKPIQAALSSATANEYGSEADLAEAIGYDGGASNKSLKVLFQRIKTSKLKKLAIRAGKIIADLDATEGDGTFKGFESASVEEAKGIVRKLIDKAKRKIKGRKDTGHPLGNDLQDLMGQYAELKKAGKGNSKKAKAIGAQIGKIKNSLRKKKEEASFDPRTGTPSNAPFTDVKQGESKRIDDVLKNSGFVWKKGDAGIKTWIREADDSDVYISKDKNGLYQATWSGAEDEKSITAKTLEMLAKKMLNYVYIGGDPR